MPARGRDFAFKLTHYLLIENSVCGRIQSIEPLFQFGYRRDHCPYVGNGTEDHAGHCIVVSLKIGEHFIVWSEGKGAGHRRIQIEMGPVEEQQGVAYAICGHQPIISCSCAGIRLKQPIHVVVVPGNTLATSFQFMTMLPPAAETMENYDLVPECLARIDCGHVFDCQFQRWYVLCDIGSDN